MISKFFRRLDPWSAMVVGIVLLVLGAIVVIFGAYQAGASLMLLGIGSAILGCVIGVAGEINPDWRLK